MPELSIIIPTFNRRAILAKTLVRLERQRTDADFEVIVIDNASDDGTDALVKSLIEGSRLQIRYLREQEHRRISRSRNRAIAETRAPVCLFLSDDVWAGDALVARHAAFHRLHTKPAEALLGRMSTPDAVQTPFMLWLDSTGMRGDYAQIVDRSDVPWWSFMAGNLSAKTEFVRSAGGFDESYLVGWEDIDLGLRLHQRGLRMHYDPAASGEHFHPLGLAEVLPLLRSRGREQARHAERFASLPMPRPPLFRFHLIAGALTALNLLPKRPDALRRMSWHFLSYEAVREGFWYPESPDDAPLRIGRRLATLACRDPRAQLPVAR